MCNFDLMIVKWSTLKTEVEIDKKTITPLDLATRLIRWSTKIKDECDDEEVGYLYDVYISQYAALATKDYDFQVVWFDFDDLLQYDFFKPQPSSVNRIFEILNLLLREIYVFKTNEDCPHCDNGYRAYMDQEFRLYLYCEQCNYYKDHDENSLSGKVIIPANRKIVEAYNLIPAIP